MLTICSEATTPVSPTRLNGASGVCKNLQVCTCRSAWPTYFSLSSTTRSDEDGKSRKPQKKSLQLTDASVLLLVNRSSNIVVELRAFEMTLLPNRLLAGTDRDAVRIPGDWRTRVAFPDPHLE